MEGSCTGTIRARRNRGAVMPLSAIFVSLLMGLVAHAREVISTQRMRMGKTF